MAKQRQSINIALAVLW